LLDESRHNEVLFPMLIPEDLLAKEAEHMKGFEDGDLLGNLWKKYY